MRGVIYNPRFRTIREIEIPDGWYYWLKIFRWHKRAWGVLEKIFEREQNHNTPRNAPSMSAGDILIVGDTRILCDHVGWARAEPEYECSRCTTTTYIKQS